MKKCLVPKRYISGSRKEGKKIPYTMTIKDRCMMIYAYRYTATKREGAYHEAARVKTEVYRAEGRRA
jgi:hypothetical protein